MTATTVLPLPSCLCFTPSKLSAGRESEGVSFPCDRHRLLYFWQFFNALCLHRAKTGQGQQEQQQYHNRVSPNAYQRRQRELSPYIVLPLPFAACTCLAYPCQLPSCALPGSGLVWFTSNNWQHHTSTTFVPTLSPSFCLSFYTRFANCFAQISMQSVELFTLLFSSILQSFNHVSFAFLCFCLFNSKAKSWARFSPVSIFLCSLSCKRAENKIVGDYSRSFWRIFWANWKRN